MDLSISALLMSFGGGWRNAWYLYSFSPILAGAIFYKVRGALITAGVSSLAYSFSLYVNGYTFEKMIRMGRLDGLISNIFSYLLIAIFFAWPVTFVDRIKRSSELLEEVNEERRKNLCKMLTEREAEILVLVARGATNKEVAQKLFLAEGTVKRHLYSTFQKLNVRNRTEAVLKAKEYELSELNKFS